MNDLPAQSNRFQSLHRSSGWVSSTTQMTTITGGSDRFASLRDWYVSSQYAKLVNYFSARAIQSNCPARRWRQIFEREGNLSSHIWLTIDCVGKRPNVLLRLADPTLPMDVRVRTDNDGGSWNSRKWRAIGCKRVAALLLMAVGIVLGIHIYRDFDCSSLESERSLALSPKGLY